MNLMYSVGLDVSSKKINACKSVINGQQTVVVKLSSVITNTQKYFYLFRELNFKALIFLSDFVWKQQVFITRIVLVFYKN